ncbi:hypothetical protein [Chryseobacterium mulctrae]|uniref:hypothetical protein n=1 Tax=Chryseobacterium mulctrae TaxID=2576777 RepID=UPI00111640AF|nr:hypothetical protein [Chryseobacterium mulctrae]
MKKIIITSTLFLLIVSCNQKGAENKIVDTAAENTESSFPIKRMSNAQNILDGIYSELIKNDAELQKLDKKVNAITSDSKIMKELYSDIINNSNDYYNIAESNAKAINDSLLKKEILAIVTNSSEKFTQKKIKFEELVKQVNINNHKIYSFYQAFKIRKTLPEIEKYQNAHPLKTDSLNNFINKQNELLNELKNLK